METSTVGQPCTERHSMAKLKSWRFYSEKERKSTLLIRWADYCSLSEIMHPSYSTTQQGHLLGDLLSWCTNLHHNITPQQGDNALHLAAIFGRLEVVQALIAEGATIDQSNSVSRHPLVQRTSPNHTFVIRCATWLISLLQLTWHHYATGWSNSTFCGGV